MRSHLSILDLIAHAIAVLFRNFSPVPISSRLFSTFSSISFSVSGFMWSSLIHLDLSFVQGDKNGSICILLHDNRQLCQHHLLKMLFFQWMVLAPLSKFKWTHVCEFIAGSSILLHWSPSLAVLVPCSFYQNCSVVQLEIRHGNSTIVSFIFENSFCSLSFLVIQMNMQIDLSNSVKIWFGFLMGIALNL